MRIKSFACAEHELTLKTKLGTTYIIERGEVYTYEVYCSLPVFDRINLFNISIEDMENYIKMIKADFIATLSHLFKQKWYYKDTGELCELTPDNNSFAFDLPYTKEYILSMARRGKFNTDMMSKIITFFDNEVYTNR